MNVYATLTNGSVAAFEGVTAITSIDLNPTISLQTTADTTAGSPVLSNVTSTTGLVVGFYAFGPGIPAGAKVAGFTANDVVVLDRIVTATATAAEVAFHGVSAADYELTRFDSGVYRDQFTASNEFLGLKETRGEGTADAGFSLATKGAAAASGMVAIPIDEMVASFDQIGSTGGAEPVATEVIPTFDKVQVSVSDEINHFAPRQLSWHEALWSISCTVGTETLVHYLRKSLVVGFSNVEPQI